MDDVRGLFLGMPHGTTPAAVTTNKNIIMSYEIPGNIRSNNFEGVKPTFRILSLYTKTAYIESVLIKQAYFDIEFTTLFRLVTQ